MKSVFLHLCCGNCACFPYEFLKEEGFDVTGFWYNPNVHPYGEYQHRLNAAGCMADRQGMNIIYDNRYDPGEFLGSMKEGFAFPRRCVSCYILRLDAAAARAREEGFSLFTTTLLYSIHQQHELIKDIGEESARKYGIEFYYSDFRKGWQKGIEISKKLELYRQSYCGCIFSEKERYLKRR